MGFADLLAVADLAVRENLGGSVTYAPSVGEPVTVEGIFDAAYQRLDQGMPGVSSSSPAVFLRLSELTSDPRTDLSATVTVDGTLYTIHEVQPDGQGGVLLLLHIG